MRDLVVLSLEAWDGVWRRNQYLMDGLLRRHLDLRILFVEPPRDHLLEFVHRRGFAPAAGLRTHPDYEGRLTLFQPGKLLPRAAGPLADALLHASLRRAVRSAGISDGILWVNDPAWAMAVPRPGWGALYDITDDWLTAHRAARQLARTVRQEERLLDAADAVVVCSEALADRRRPRRPDVALVRNAVDLVRYRIPRDRPDDLPDGPVGLYVGTLHEDRLDLDLVVRTAAALRSVGGHVVLLGPVALDPAAVQRLRDAPGVHLVGARDHRDVPAYLQHAGVLLVPHVVDAFTDSLDPLKLWEYLAVGRPVIATPVAGFRDPGVARRVVLAEAEAFPTEVLAALGTPDAETAPTVPTWEERIDEVEAVFTSISDRRGV